VQTKATTNVTIIEFIAELDGRTADPHQSLPSTGSATRTTYPRRTGLIPVDVSPKVAAFRR
jgi:hypothetical protein